MKKIIDHIEVEGRRALGFDTGLSPAAFAQAKLAQLLSAEGLLVRSDGTTSPWRPEGVAERDGTMVVWGPDFSGESLDVLLEGGGALDALRAWIGARSACAEGTERPAPYPAAALIGEDGSVLFPPTALVLRGLDALGPDARRRGADRWIHPDRSGADADAFAAAAMAYRIFAGDGPFGDGRFAGRSGGEAPSAEAAADALRADIREGLCLPARLAAPALRRDAAELLDRTLGPAPSGGRGAGGKGPDASDASRSQGALGDLERLLGERGSGGPERFLEAVPTAALAELAQERDRFIRRRGTLVARRRFLRRNAVAIAAVFALILGAVLAGRSIAAGRASRPTTAGLAPLEVAAAYYGAFGALDHEMMEACTVDKAGEGDVGAVLNLFVISRVREAYERKSTVISAEAWIADGSPETDATVFGVTDLELETLGGWESEGELTVRARYRFWYPQDRRQDEAAPAAQDRDPAPRAPAAAARTDTLRIVLRKGLWRIAELRREED